MIPRLAGVHHLKLPVSDLDRSIAWYRERLGYEVTIEFRERGELMGVVMRHPSGGPDLGFRLDPAKALSAAGFDFFGIGVPDKEALDELVEHLDKLGDPHAGVQQGTIGWVLPMLHDPDGHEIRFYTVASHTVLEHGTTMVVESTHRSTASEETTMN